MSKLRRDKKQWISPKEKELIDISLRAQWIRKQKNQNIINYTKIRFFDKFNKMGEKGVKIYNKREAFALSLDFILNSQSLFS